MKSAKKAFGDGKLNPGANRSEQRASYRVFEHAIFRYGLSIVSVAVALSVTLLSEGYTFRTPFFFPAIILSTWVGGVGPGLLSVFLSTLCINYFILDPKFAISPLTFQDALHLSAFLVSALLVSSWSAARKRAEYALHRTRAELETRVQARTADLQRANEQLQREVAERMRIDETLRERASLLDLTHDTVFVRDMQDVITYWNHGAEDLYGWSSQEAVGQVTHQLTRTIFPAPLDEINAQLLATGRWEGELIHTKRDGTKVVVASRWSLQHDEQGNPSAILETNNDVTERKKAEEALRQSRDDLEIRVKERTADLQSVNKELEAFAYSVSHDLRAPVRHIAGFSELLQKHSGPMLDDVSRRHISMILDSANRMGSLVDDLLAFSRIGRAETQTTTIHLEQLVKGVVGEIAPETQGRNIAWRIGTLPVCYGDPSMLRLVFGNLISNAVKFTRPRLTAQIEIGSMNHQPNEVIVFIKDNGVGFDMKYQDKLFGVFQRLHSQEAFEGTGIGLATVERVVHRHGGRVWAESSVDRGATFFVALPKPER